MRADILKKDEETIKINDLIGHLMENSRIDECGAIFSFEGIVRGLEPGKNVKKLDMTTSNIKKTEDEFRGIIKEIENKYSVIEIAAVHYVGEFSQGDDLFLVAVAGPHRDETLEALKEVIERTKYELDFKKEEYTEEGTNIIMSGG